MKWCGRDLIVDMASWSFQTWNLIVTFFASLLAAIPGIVALVRQFQLKPNLEIKIYDAFFRTFYYPSRETDSITYFEVQGEIRNNRLQGTTIGVVLLEAPLLQERSEERDNLIMEFTFAENPVDYPVEVGSYYQAVFILKGQIMKTFLEPVPEGFDGTLIFKSYEDICRNVHFRFDGGECEYRRGRGT